MSRILLVDDDRSLRGVLAFALREDGHLVVEAEDGDAGLERFREDRPDLVITDLKMPRKDGMELLAAIRAEDPETPVLMLTAFGTIEQAVEAMKRGAFNYLTKPYNREELRLVVANALERGRLLAENRDLRRRLEGGEGESRIIYASEAIGALIEKIRRVAPSDATVLVTGESGTGKELVANYLHRLSDRAPGPLIAVNCGALPRDLIESELFGHKKGAFTGAIKDKQGKFRAASGGTLLLDEIGELSADLQTKLLRVLETGRVDVVGGDPVSVDVRLVAATNRDLGRAVSDGIFREDLFYRLNVIPLHVPALRDRREDIPLLWKHFTRKFAEGTPVETSPELMTHLTGLSWKGNVRELANLSQRLVLLRKGDTLGLGDLPAVEGDIQPGDAVAPDQWLGDLPAGSLSLRDVEKEIIRKALDKFKGNKTRAAKYLAIPRHVLLYRIEKYEIGGSA